MAMIIGTLTASIEIPGSQSLKDKRQAVRSLLDGLRNKFNVSAAELEQLDSHTYSTIGVACVSNDQAFANKVLDSAAARIGSDRDVVLLDYSIEFL